MVSDEDKKRMYDVAKARYDSGFDEESIRLFTTLLDTYAEDSKDYLRAMAFHGRARAHLGLSQLERARKDIGKALHIVPGDAQFVDSGKLIEAYRPFLQGIEKYNNKDYQEAVDSLTNAVEIYPKFSRAWNARGLAKRELEQFDGAIEDFEKARELEPNERGITNNILEVQTQQANQEAIKQRFRLLKASTDDLKAEAQRYRDEHKLHKAELKTALDNLFLMIAVIVGVLATIFLVLISLGITPIQLDVYLPFVFTPWFIMTALVISPKVSAIRNLMQQANKAEMMAAEYAHLAYIEDRILVYFASNTDAKSIDVKADYLKAMLGKTPSDKLLAIINRGKGKADGNQSPTERIISKIPNNSGDKTSS